jgi:hypothetical protein
LQTDDLKRAVYGTGRWFPVAARISTGRGGLGHVSEKGLCPELKPAIHNAGRLARHLAVEVRDHDGAQAEVHVLGGIGGSRD